MDPAAPTRLIAELVGASGPCSTVSTACTSSSQAVGEGVLRIRRGDADAMIVGGVDVLVDAIMITGFAKLGALSERNAAPSQASRPFDVGRDGFVSARGRGVGLEERTMLSRGAPWPRFLDTIIAMRTESRIPPDGRGHIRPWKPLWRTQ